LANKIISQVEFEISQIEQLLASYAELLARANKTKPDLIEVTALGSVHILTGKLQKAKVSD